ncbi:MAG: cell wall-active antibiotics response protein [Spirochaetes bacterium]|nr:cell wall-active antibiotics response protein [Spirochaetota bacterium]
MASLFDEKEAVSADLSDQYAKGLLGMEDFERLLGDVSKAGSVKELGCVKKAVYSNLALGRVPAAGKGKKRRYETFFSSRTITAESANGHAGCFSCVFGANRIFIIDLPPGRTILEVETVFGFTEVFVAKNIKIENEASAIFGSVSTDGAHAGGLAGEGQSELHIKGDAVFGNITVRSV